ncbi:arsinothricin resistance N-acetyltransferase ArsN1 family B [Dokdonella fugitiva]|uniref:Phosphinothricin acetyltransferase n=1 Tax=Dokdonella fugitiva TaxID=328517 RepID=A0A4R2I586_9GAMM|nr:arsinothricin resistance N-acetyltransferase ArsN1 family B [Dokdonella fugitiva]TCO38288.1 phosphinothricin acetyltransferase [Dokdonella fugitiva]
MRSGGPSEPPAAALIRRATRADAAAIAAVYDHYVRSTHVTFEEAGVDAHEMERRIADVEARGLPWLVSECDGEVAGYAYAGPWKARSAYRHTVESTIYLAHGRTGRGLGLPLCRALIEALHACGAHAVIGGIALPNAASIALHEKAGFHAIGRFAEVGRKFDRWIDVGYWQRLL